MKTLIQPFEVIINAPVRKDYPIGYVCDHIFRVEQKIFSECLGLDLLKDMIDKCIQYSGQGWDNCKDYQIDEIVVIDGVYFKSLENGNSENPIDSDKWIQAKKFENECYNELSECYLKNILAYSVIYTSITYKTIQAGAKGLVVMTEDDTFMTGAGEKGLSMFKKELLIDISDLKELMHTYIQTKEGCFESLKNDICGESKCNSKSQNRRILFR